MLGKLVDQLFRQIIVSACTVLLVAMVLFTCYTVVMRGVFENPPFWGDTLTLMANVWLVFLAMALPIRERESIAMQMIYDYMPARWTLACDMVWNILFIFVGLIMLVFGYQTAVRIPGVYWELGDLPKGYLVMIVPISGGLLILACMRVLIEDVHRWRSGEAIERHQGLEV